MPRGPRSTQAVYLQIAEELRTRIEAGDLAPGQQLPTEHQLAEDHQVTRTTVRQALSVLTNAGVVEARRPRGHFVTEVEREYHRPQGEFRPRPESPQLDIWMSDQASKGREASQDISVEIVQASNDVAHRLAIPQGDLVVVRRRVRYLDGTASYLNDSYYPESLVRGSEIVMPADIGRGANQVLAELNAEQVRAIDEIEARMPRPDEATRLDLGRGAPVMVLRTTGYASDDRPVRTVTNILPGTRYVIAYERTKEQDHDHS